MIEKENKFEEQLNSRILLKALLLAEGNFDEELQQHYDHQLNLTFQLIT